MRAIKKTAVGLMLTAVLLLVAAFLGIPLHFARMTQLVLIGIALLLALVSSALLLRDPIRARRGMPKPPAWLMMRRSGAFDIAMLLLILALLLCLLALFGLISYNTVFHRHAVLAAAGGPVPQTMEALRQLPGFVEYNFKQELNLFAQGRAGFLSFGLIFAAIAGLMLLYLRFISPLVRIDTDLQRAHAFYRHAGQTALAALITLIILFPIYWMIITSFKTSDELLQTVPTLWPNRFVWENYPNVLQRAPFLRYLLNTLVTTLCIMGGELTLGVLAAYGFSKGDFRGRDTLFMVVLGALMVPIQVTFVPIYVLIARLNAIDTWAGVILPNLVSAYFIFMLRQNFMAVDNSYIEAGKIDGMGRIGTIFYVLCPMCKPTLITVGIISFINGWNSYFWPKMVTKTEMSRTIAVGVQQLKNTFAGQEVSNYNEIMAGAVMAIVPIVLLFLFLQKYIMTGMSKAAMK